MKIVISALKDSCPFILGGGLYTFGNNVTKPLLWDIGVRDMDDSIRMIL